jgi:putative NADH-flavin reductase
MVEISIFGGTGYAGGNIAAEAARRGHAVTSYSRSEPTARVDGVRYVIGSADDQAVVEPACSTSDVIVVALPAHPPTGQRLPDIVAGLIGPATEHGVRLGVIGGAGSSLVNAGGTRVVDDPEFPDDWRPEAVGHVDVLDLLRGSDPALDWFVVSPPAMFGASVPGETTGSYRTGGDVLVTKDDGSSEISGTDFARAVVDEIEQRHHVRERFTVGH